MQIFHGIVFTFVNEIQSSPIENIKIYYELIIQITHKTISISNKGFKKE
jgi:hypothetical protein